MNTKELYMDMYKKGIICVDFDGTIVEHDYPRIGEPLPGAIETLKDLKEAGWALILWTCREDQGYDISKQYLQFAIDFLKDHGVEFDGHNETPMEFEFRSEKHHRRKAYAQIYIDDRNLGGFPGWNVVRELLLED